MARLQGYITAGALTLTSGTFPAWDGSLATLAGAQINWTGSPASNGGYTISGTPTTTTATVTPSVSVGSSGSPVSFYVGQEWSAAENTLIYYGMATKPPISTTHSRSAANGGNNGQYMGSDSAFSCDMTNAGWSGAMWGFADTFWSTAAGQARSAATTIHNCIALQTGGAYNLTSDTITFYPGGTGTVPLSFIMYQKEMQPVWPLSAYCVNQYCLLIFCQLAAEGEGVTAAVRTGVLWVMNPANTNPAQWQMQFIPTPFADSFPGCSNGAYAPGDGYLYLLGSDNINQGGLYTVRVPWADVNIGSSGVPSFARAQAWCGPGLGWVLITPRLGRKMTQALTTPFLTAYPPFDINADDQGTFWQRSDSTYNFIGAAIGGANSGLYAINVSGWPTALSAGDVGPLIYQPTQNANSDQWVYAGKAHPEQTWSGKATDDVLLSYATNVTDPATHPVTGNATTYWPHLVRCTGL